MDTPTNKPLTGLRVLVTRSRDQASDLSAQLTHLGAEPIEAPLIRIEDPDNWMALDQALAHITAYDWLIFTSTNGVDQFFKRFMEKGFHIDLLASVRVAVVGRATAARVQHYGLTAAHQPERFSAEALVDTLARNEVLEKARVLFPGADIARRTVVNGLTAYGAEVTSVTVYQTIAADTLPDEILALLAQKAIHLITFASSSTVRAFLHALGSQHLTILQGVTIACIGPVTRDTAQEAGLPVDIMPDEASISALVEAIVHHRSHTE